MLVLRGGYLLGWVVALVIVPATATAATVFTREGDLNGELVPWTVFEAAAGEANRVTATNVADFSAARWGRHPQPAALSSRPGHRAPLPGRS